MGEMREMRVKEKEEDEEKRSRFIPKKKEKNEEDLWVSREREEKTIK